MTAYQFSQSWLSNDDKTLIPVATEFAHLRTYLKGIDDGSITLFNPHFLNSTINSLTVSGNIAMGGFKLTGLGAGTTNGDSLRYEQLIGLYLLLTGGTMSGAIAMGSNKITGLANGTVSTDAATFGQYQQATSNILDNGGMEIWQRGTSFVNPAANALTADRWHFQTSNSSVTVSREASLIDSGTYAMKFDITGAGNGNWAYVNEAVEEYKEYAGKTVSLSARIKANAAGFKIALYDGVSFTFSSGHSGGNTYETLTATKTLSASLNQLTIIIGFDSADGGGVSAPVSTSYIDSVMLIVGSEPVSFVPANPDIDLHRCKRYFQIYGNGAGVGEDLPLVFATSTTAFLGGSYRFPVTMRAAPTSTITSTSSFLVNDGLGSGNVACSTLTFDGLTIDGSRYSGTVAGGLTAGRSMIFQPQAGTVSFTADI